MHLNDKKATGIENIPVKVIKMTAEYISSVLFSLFNKYTVNGTFPSKLKLQKLLQYVKVEVLTWQRTIALYQFCPPSPKFLKKSFIKDFKSTLHHLILLQKNNFGLEQSTQQIM